jgi:hypothetical protein
MEDITNKVLINLYFPVVAAPYSNFISTVNIFWIAGCTRRAVFCLQAPQMEPGISEDLRILGKLVLEQEEMNRPMKNLWVLLYTTH